jgi:hypothetical protein
MSTKSTIKNENKYSCEKCDYFTSKKTDYSRHILTDKHKRNVLSTYVNHYSTIKNEFTCENCNKKYKERTGLWRHKNKGGCINNNDIKDGNIHLNEINNKDELIVLLVKQNAELIKEQNDIKNIMIGQQNMMIGQQNLMMEQQNMMMKVIENGTNNTNNTNITHTNSHNKAFNLNFFLNETCKDAMNITDFVDSIKLQLSDLEKVGEVGYVEGISNIIIKNLNDLDETKRPVHCTDKKRETIYIKDQGQWEKEDDNNTKLKKSINKIAHKNIKLITEFREKYPECRKSESRISDKYNKMIIEAMGGPGDNNVEKSEKIIRNITKVISINK